MNTSPAKSTQQKSALRFTANYLPVTEHRPKSCVITKVSQIRPLGNVRLFRIICKNDIIFLNMCVSRGNLVNYFGNLQIIRLGNVRIFRRIRKHDAPFLKACVFFAEFVEIRMFRRKYVIFVNR